MSFRPGGYFRLTADAGAIPALDGLRGIAILMVVLYHVTESFVSEQQPLLRLAGWDVATPLLNGWMGVQLFFVLSGFLITHHLLRRFRTDRGPELGRYLVKRWLRIAPTYYVILAIVALGLVPYYEVEPGRMGARVIYHALFLQDYLPSSLLAPFWSLGVEEKFYLAAPLVALVVISIGRPRSGLIVLLALACVPLAVRLGMLSGIMPVPEGGFTRVWRNPFHLSRDALVIGSAIAWLAGCVAFVIVVALGDDLYLRSELGFGAGLVVSAAVMLAFLTVRLRSGIGEPTGSPAGASDPFPPFAPES